jgi:hypothetical protein
VAGVVWDLGDVLMGWDPLVAVTAAGVGEQEARWFRAGCDVAG